MSSAESGTAVRPGLAKRVVINTAGATHISGLYGIDPALAARIVAFREQNGPFHGPDDLARVEGIGDELAYVLAPHIDWSDAHAAGDEAGRSVLAFVACLLGFGLSVAWLAPRLYEWVVLFPYDDIQGQDLWAPFFANLLIACFAGILAVGGGIAITRSRSRRRALLRHMIWPASGFLIALAACTTLVTVTDPEIWDHVLGSPRARVSLVAGGLVATGLSIFVLIGFQPRLANNRFLTGALNAVCLLLVPAAASFVWMNRTDFPLLVSLGWALAGFVFLDVGIKVLRGFSLAHAITGFVPGSRQADAETLWLRWINSRLPDPEQQQALLDALQQRYPPSRWRTVPALVITGAGTWILAATASAVWEWMVQSWLDSRFGAP